ncbi:Pentatricopeptide repeat [Dillenia turbinata]|uniref:Pentatricopeptide repeat n=1 Tax=Dillenia turbinata TaxID=194707 RepID=A0AAN8VXU3_9MAGN
MRGGGHSLLPPWKTSVDKLGEILLTAAVTKSLRRSPAENLDGDSFSVSEPVLLKLLSSNSIDASKKLDFFFKWCSSSSSSNPKPSSIAYSALIRTLCRDADNLLLRRHVPDILSSIISNNVVLEPSAFKLILDSFIKRNDFDSALQILEQIQLSRVIISDSNHPSLYTSLLIALVRKDQVLFALSIFYKLLDSNSHIPVSIVCNELLVALRKSNLRSEFEKLFYRLRERANFRLDRWGYNICIHAFGIWGDIRASLDLFSEFKLLNPFGPDLCTYNSLILGFCLVGRVKDGLNVFEELKGSAHEPDLITYRILICGCCKSYRINDATRLFEEMKNKGFRPDVVIYNSMIDGLMKARKLNDACQLFENMVQEGIRTSSWTYNILIDGLFKNGRVAAGYSLFCDLKKKGNFVDGVTYSIVILQHCREGQVDGALTLVEEMEGRGFVVDLVTITSLLIGLHREGRWDSTERLLKHIRDGTLLPSVLKWKADMDASMKNWPNRSKDFMPLFPSKGALAELINSRGSDANLQSDGGNGSEDVGVAVDEWSSSPYMDQLANQPKSQNDWFQSFSLSRGQRVQGKGADSFDIDMVNTYLSIFLSNGKLSVACKLFEIFTDMGVNTVSYTYNSIMSSFVKKGYFNEMWDVLHEMGEKLCPADVATYNLIIQGLGKMGRADLASSVLDKLMSQGGYLDIVMYNTLINALGKAGRLDEVNKLFKQMRSSGINPDVVTFNTLIEVHSKAGRLKEAYKFLKMMLDSGCMPNHITDTCLDYLGNELDKLRYQKASIKHVVEDDTS